MECTEPLTLSQWMEVEEERRWLEMGGRYDQADWLGDNEELVRGMFHSVQEATHPHHGPFWPLLDELDYDTWLDFVLSCTSSAPQDDAMNSSGPPDGTAGTTPVLRSRGTGNHQP